MTENSSLARLVLPIFTLLDIEYRSMSQCWNAHPKSVHEIKRLVVEKLFYVDDGIWRGTCFSPFRRIGDPVARATQPVTFKK